MSYIGREPVPQATRYIQEGVIDANTTTVLPVTGGYTVDNIAVFVNGVRKDSSEYTATDGLSITFNESLVIGDSYLIEEYRTFEVAEFGTAAVKDVATNAEALAGTAGVLTDAAGVHAAFKQYGLGTQGIQTDAYNGFPPATSESITRVWRSINEDGIVPAYSANFHFAGGAQWGRLRVMASATAPIKAFVEGGQSAGPDLGRKQAELLHTGNGATAAEVQAGTNTTKWISPSALTSRTATETRTGLVELATSTEVQTGTDTARAVTPSALASRTATETRTGLVELATNAEVQAGTDSSRAVTPSALASRTATETRTGLVELATAAEAQAGTDTSRAVTPAGLASRTATETRTGLVEKATTAEAQAGTVDKFPDAAGVHAAFKQYGLGTNAKNVGTDFSILDSPLTLNGFYEVTDLTWTSAPPGDTQYRIIHIRHSNINGFATQIAFPFKGGRAFIRTAYTSLTFGPWVEVQTTDNGATAAEVQAGTDTTKWISPAALSFRGATETRTGLVELATNAEVQAGTDSSRAVTPAGLSARTATETRTGLVEKATNQEALDGTADKFPDAAQVHAAFKQYGLGTQGIQTDAYNGFPATTEESITRAWRNISPDDIVPAYSANFHFAGGAQWGRLRVFASAIAPIKAFIESGQSTGVDLGRKQAELHHTGNILTATGQSQSFPMTQKAVTDALNTKLNTSEKAAANGVATLDANTKVPEAQLPIASLTDRGVVRLSNSVADTRTTFAATANAVRIAYDRASEAASSTTLGGLKARLDGTTLYLRNDGDPA